MRRPTRPFTVEFKSRRKPVQGFISDESRGRLIDEPAPDEVPSRDVSEDAPASAGDDTPFAAANRVFSKFTSSAVSTAASLGDLASSVFAPQRPEPSPAAAPDEHPRSGRILPSLVPVNSLEGAWAENRDASLTDTTPKRRRTPATPARNATRSERAPHQDETPRLDRAPDKKGGFAETNLPALDRVPVPNGPKPNRPRADTRVPAGERWRRPRLPKACW